MWPFNELGKLFFREVTEGRDPKDSASLPGSPPLPPNLCFFSLQGARGERGQPGATGQPGPKVWRGWVARYPHASLLVQAHQVPPNTSLLSLFCSLSLIHSILG